MFLTEKEIMEQHVALTRTFQYFIENKAVIEEFFQQHTEKKFLFLGCLQKPGRESLQPAETRQLMPLQEEITW